MPLGHSNIEHPNQPAPAPPAEPERLTFTIPGVGAQLHILVRLDGPDGQLNQQTVRATIEDVHVVIEEQ